MLHFVPWKPKITYITDGNGGQTPVEEPMDWKDAAKVALVLMVANLFIVWLPGKPLPTCQEEAITFIYSLIIFMGQNFFSAFISLTGLTLLYADKKEKT